MKAIHKSNLILAYALLTVALSQAGVVLNTNDAGAGSLRQVIIDATPNDTLTFTNTLAGGTITLTTGQMVINKNLTIDASAIGGITIDADNATRVFSIGSASTLILESLRLINGIATSANPNDRGGAVTVAPSSSLILSNCELSDNTAIYGGSIYCNMGTLQIIRSTLSGNHANTRGGALYLNQAPCTLNNSTLTGNSSDVQGGSVAAHGSTVTLNNTTLTGNSAVTDGGGIYRVTGGTLSITNSIVAGNSGDNIFGGADSAINSLTNGPPILATLGDYGGPTPTMPPLLGSPAIDAGLTSATNSLTDQRGLTRVANGTVDIGAVEVQSSTIVLNTNDTGLGSLRNAIDNEAPSVITFDNALAGQTITLTSQLYITRSLTIDASAIGGIAINGNNWDRIFLIASGTTNLFDSLTITNGTAVLGDGGGIYNNSGNLTLNNSTVSGNSAFYGGGIFNSGELTLNHSTLSDNSADSYGGGIFNSDALTLNNSTLSGNSASSFGGGIHNAGMLIINNATITSNDASNQGGGIYNVNSFTLYATNSIVSGNTALNDPNIYGSITSGANNITTGDPMLAPLGDYGGPTQTMPPLPFSPAVDAGLTSATNSLTDQRGVTRVLNGIVDIGAVEYSTNDFALVSNLFLPTDITPTNGTVAVSTTPTISWTPYTGPGNTFYTVYLNDQLQGPGILGSFTVIEPLAYNTVYTGRVDTVIESHIFTGSNFLFTTRASTVVDTLADPGTLGNGLSSLRQAIGDAEAGETITFTNTLAGQTIFLTDGQLTIDQNLNIDASAIGGIVIDGHGSITSNRVFEITSGITNLFDSLTITNGNAVGSNGGGILNNGVLTLNNSTLSGNTSPFGSGGGIYSVSVLTLNSSTLSGNSAYEGGAIRNSGSMTLNNSTLSANDADYGGGIVNYSTLTLNNSTLLGNSSNNEGGGIYNFSTLNSTNSIIAGNTAPTNPNISGTIGSDINNLTSGDPQLAPLGDYGGPTQTMPPLAGSPAIDGGLTSATNSLTDQRGIPRVLTGSVGATEVDIGAVEYHYWLIGQDLSGIDPSAILPGAVYDSTTVFPGGFDPEAAGLLELLSSSGKTAIESQGFDLGVDTVTNNPIIYDLYTSSAFQALALDRPFLTYNALSNSFTLTIGILQTPDLVNVAFTNLTGFTTTPYPGDGEIDIEFTPPNADARFFQVYGSEPAP